MAGGDNSEVMRSGSNRRTMVADWIRLLIGSDRGPRQGVEDLRELLHKGAQGDCEAEVFQVSNDDTAVAQRRLKDQHEEKTNTDCLVREQKKGHSTLSLKDSLSRDCDVEKNGSLKANLHRLKCIKYINLVRGVNLVMGKEVVGDVGEVVDVDSPWNQWLLSEFPNLFVSAERSFCSLPCFKENQAKGVSIFMSFVPLGGEVRGALSSLPHMIISNLRVFNCLLLEGDDNDWAHPCKVVRNWTERCCLIV
ncbi:hypothetical protein Tco_0792033 [Tanacetum coccineum]